MKAKSILTAALLAFVALSVAVLIFKQVGEPAERGERRVAASGEVASTNDDETAGRVDPGESRIVVSYLHGTARCRTCRILEENAAEAIDRYFGDEVSRGEIEFRVVNVAHPENSHLARKYGLHSQSVIVSEMAGDEERRWKNLDRIWSLVRDKDAYLDYVRREVEEFRSES